jgi:hypothetical protein
MSADEASDSKELILVSYELFVFDIAGQHGIRSEWTDKLVNPEFTVRKAEQWTEFKP